MVKGGERVTPISIVGLNDFHGQLELDPTTTVRRRINVPSAAPAHLATMFDEELGQPARPGPDPGRRRQRRRVAAELGAARGHADDRRRERLGPRRHVATATTSSTTACSGSSTQQARRALPVPGRRTSSRPRPAQPPSWVHAVEGLQRQRRQGRRHRRRARDDAGARLGRRHGRADVPRRGDADQGRVGAPAQAGRQGPGRASSTRAPIVGPNTARQRRRHGLGRARSSTSPTQLQDTTVDAMIVGHTHRVSNLDASATSSITEGINAGASYSVAPADGQGRRRRVGRRRDAASRRTSASRRGPTSRRSSTRPTPRPPCSATRSSARRRTTSRATSTRLARVGDGQHGRRRDAGEVPGRRGRLHRTPAACGQDISFASVVRR